MAEETITRSIREALRKRRIALVEAVASGQCKDHAAYKHMVGQIAALREADGIVVETVRAYFGEEDETENE